MDRMMILLIITLHPYARVIKHDGPYDQTGVWTYIYDTGSVGIGEECSPKVSVWLRTNLLVGILFILTSVPEDSHPQTRAHTVLTH